MQKKASRGDRSDGNFRQPDRASNAGLVEPIGHFPANGREHKERRNEDDAGERHEHAGVLAQPPRRPAQAKQNEHAQRILEEIVVQGRAELAPEQGSKPPRSHQGLEHLSALSQVADPRPLREDPRPYMNHVQYPRAPPPPANPMGQTAGSGARGAAMLASVTRPSQISGSIAATQTRLCSS